MSALNNITFLHILTFGVLVNSGFSWLPKILSLIVIHFRRWLF